MDLLSLIAGFTVGVLVGIGGSLYYLKWKMGQQIGQMEQQMNEMMDATQGLAKDFDELDEMEEQDFPKDEENREKEE